MLGERLLKLFQSLRGLNHDLDQILLEGEEYLKLVQQIIDELYKRNLLIYPDGKRGYRG